GAENHCGGANWIFSDSTSGGRVACEVDRAGGEVDGVRLPKEAYYVCQAMFRDDPQVHIIGHWNYPADTRKTVYVASNGDEVELLVNGQSLGRAKPKDHYLFTFPDVAWQTGEIKAISYCDNQPIATHRLHTIGAPVALKMTQLTSPDGLQANGSDVALIDVEAVDNQGQRCPTFQQRVDFALEGPGIWRGGYNSGKIKSTNNPYLDLECGINRVAVRSTLNDGEIVVRATSEGLRPASITLNSLPVKIDAGATPKLPTMPIVSLTKPRAMTSLASSDPVLAGADPDPPAKQGGNYVKNFSYSGPTKNVHIETDAKNGKRVYLDRNEKFSALPECLCGSDWIQAAAADRAYSAVDLMEIPAPAHSIIYVAFDARLDRPDWLANQFEPTDTSLVIADKPMKLYRRAVASETSFTLGSNTEHAPGDDCNMYLVFVHPAPE
ncbi:MAG TPA: DUF4982 domain-containing protein, partial [Pirellulales bacterium]